MTIRTIIIDDEPEARSILAKLCERNEHDITIQDTCATIEQALSSIERNKPNLLLLDIQLSEGLGFEVLDQFEDRPFNTVFVSAFDQYALRAVKYHALDYLIKPVDEDEFNSMIQRVRKRCDTEPSSDFKKLREYLEKKDQERIGVPTTHGTHYYHLDEIVRLESDGSYTIISIRSGEKVMVCKYLKEFERALPDNNFLRTHRKHLVNLHWVRGLNKDEGGYLVMKNGDRVPVSRGAKDSVESHLQQGSLRL